MTRRLLAPVPLAVFLVSLVFVAGGAPTASAQDPVHGAAKAPPRGNSSVDTPGLDTNRGSSRLLVGDSAPDIELREDDGTSFHLGDAVDRSAWLLVFARFPGDAAGVDGALDSLTALGVRTIVVAPFHRARLAAGLPGTALRLAYDRTSGAARIYGLFDPVTSNPRPGVFLVERGGR